MIKPLSTTRKAANKLGAMILAYAAGVDIDTSKFLSDGSIWVYPPNELPVEKDPFKSCGHFCGDWSEVLNRVHIYAKLIVPTQKS